MQQHRPEIDCSETAGQGVGVKKCPYCGDDVGDSAVLCWHCDRDLPPPPGKGPVSPAPSPTVAKEDSLDVGEAQEGSGDTADAARARSALEGAPLFSSVSSEVWDRLFLLYRPRTERFAKGATVIERGGEGNEAYLIIEGRAVVSQGGRQIQTLGPGELFGEMSVLEGGRRSATVAADSDLTCVVITHLDLRHLLEREGLYNEFIRILVERLREQRLREQGRL